MLEQNIINAYSLVHTPQVYTNDDNPSFDGSQRQSEFFKAWNVIKTYYDSFPSKTLTFLEVGAWKGLWGLAFLEFCKLNNIKGKYVTITMLSHDPSNTYLLNTVNYMNKNGLESHIINMNTFNPDALSEVKKYSENYNMVFIDAGHQYHEAKNDIDKFASLSTNLLMFHDIRPIIPTSHCGVYQAIKDSNIDLDIEISVNSNEMGIGIKLIK